MPDDPKSTLSFKQTQLVITWPDGRQTRVPLVNEVTRIGRGALNDIVIPQGLNSISRKHLEVRREGAQYLVVDLKSSNGVFVNGQKVDQILLNDKDEIRIGRADHKQELRVSFQVGTKEFTNASSDTKTAPLVMNLPTAPPSSVAYLSIRWPNGQTKFFPIDKDMVLAGRSPEADLRIPEGYGFVSVRHFELRRIGSAFTITDLNSTNGTLLDDHPLTPNTPAELHHNADIRIGDDEIFGFSLDLTFHNPFEPAQTLTGLVMAEPSVFLRMEKPVTIGRLPENDIVLTSPDVSRRHAIILIMEKSYVLQDQGSKNGTYVNDKPVQSAKLQNGDRISICNYLLTFQDGQITVYENKDMHRE